MNREFFKSLTEMLVVESSYELKFDPIRGQVRPILNNVQSVINSSVSTFSTLTEMFRLMTMKWKVNTVKEKFKLFHNQREVDIKRKKETTMQISMQASKLKRTEM